MTYYQIQTCHPNDMKWNDVEYLRDAEEQDILDHLRSPTFDWFKGMGVRVKRSAPGYPVQIVYVGIYGSEECFSAESYRWLMSQKVTGLDISKNFFDAWTEEENVTNLLLATYPFVPIKFLIKAIGSIVTETVRTDQLRNPNILKLVDDIIEYAQGDEDETVASRLSWEAENLFYTSDYTQAVSALCGAATSKNQAHLFNALTDCFNEYINRSPSQDFDRDNAFIRRLYADMFREEFPLLELTSRIVP